MDSKMSNHENKVAFISGANRGIGIETAKKLGELGITVIIGARDVTKGKAAANELISRGIDTDAIYYDANDSKSANDVYAYLDKHYGKLDILVNNAGYTWDGVVHKMTDKQWVCTLLSLPHSCNTFQEAMLLVHNTAPFRLIRAAAPYMREPAKIEQEKGLPLQPRCIVNVSSYSFLLS